MATFVLVPGGWCGGWSWKFVVPCLRDAGHEVYPVTLTGLGDRVHLAHPDIDLETHAQDVANVLRYEDLTEVILVGWSYGGAVVAVASHWAPERIQRVVILDSDLIPEDGQSIYDIDPELRDRDESLFCEGNDWQISVPPPSRILESIIDADRRRWFTDRRTPQPARTYSQPVRLANPAADELLYTLIRCTQSPSWDEDVPSRFLKRIRVDPRWEIIDLEGNHLAPVVDPAATAGVLMSVGGVSP